MKYKAVFLDKNGTFTAHVPYRIQTSGVDLKDDVIEGLQRLQSYGYLLVVVCNESGIAHGYFTMDEVNRAKDALFNKCSRLGVYLDGFYCCPHHPLGIVQGYNEQCQCRKPLPGLLTRAGGDLGIDLSYSWMVGNVLNDVEAGNRAGCKSIMINDGSETRWISGAYRLPEYFATDLAEASKFVVASDKMRKETDARRQSNVPVQA